MGLHVDIYKSKTLGDCTNGGITAKVQELCLVNVSGPFEPNKKIPGALLVEGNLPGTAKIVPLKETRKGKWFMFGGNFAYSSDARFNDAVEKLQGTRGPVAIHDRTED
jgi:hypothetical protein